MSEGKRHHNREGTGVPATRQRITRTTTHAGTRDARRFVEHQLERWDQAELSDDAQIVGSELVTNALLHAPGDVEVRLQPLDDGVRIEVHDRSPHLPVPPPGDGRAGEAMTGRGLQLVQALADRWGAERTPEGKVVWAELTPGPSEAAPAMSDEDLLALWDDDLDGLPAAERHRVVLRDVPVDLLLQAKAHTDNLVREFALAAAGAEAGLTTEVPPELAELLETVTTAFADARHAMERQALSARQRGEETVDVELRLPPGAAEAATDYLEALDAADAHCRNERLLTLATPARHRAFRGWYVEEIVRQLQG